MLLSNSLVIIVSVAANYVITAQDYRCTAIKDLTVAILIAVFNEKRTLKFNLNQRFTLFTAVNHLSRPLRKQKFSRVKKSLTSVGCD